MAVDMSFCVCELAHFDKYLVDLFISGRCGNAPVGICSEEIVKHKILEYLCMETFAFLSSCRPFSCIHHNIGGVEGIEIASGACAGIAAEFAGKHVKYIGELAVGGLKICIKVVVDLAYSFGICNVKVWRVCFAPPKPLVAENSNSECPLVNCMFLLLRYSESILKVTL